MPTLRPIDRLLGDTFRILWRQWPSVLVVSLVSGFLGVVSFVYLLATIASPVIYWLIAQPGGLRSVHSVRAFLSHLAQAFPDHLWLLGLCCIPFVLLMSLVNIWGIGAMIAAFAHGSNRRARVLSVCCEGITTTIPLFWLSLVSFLIIAGGIVCGIVPGIILALGLAIATCVCVLERRSLDGALSHSWARTRGHRWAILGRYLLFFLIIFGTAAVMRVMQLLPLVNIAAILLQICFQLVQTAFFLAPIYLIYLDLRVPAEGVAGQLAGQETSPIRAPRVWFGFFAVVGTLGTLGSLVAFLLLVDSVFGWIF